MKKLTVTAAAALALIAGLTACTPGNTVTPAAASSAAPAAATTPTATPTPTTAGAAKFGDTVTFPGGVKVTVSQPTAEPASASAAGAVEGKIVKFTVSVTNTGTQPLNAALMSVATVSYGADGRQAQHAYDKDTVGFFRTVLPGETQTMKQGYGVPSAGFGSLRVEVNGPNMMSDQPAIFKGPVQ